MKRLAFSLSLILAFAGCVELREARAPEPKAAASESAVVPAARSEESLEIETFYARVEAGLLSRGLLRSDGGGPDTPFTDEMLTRNFLAIAFSEEFSEVGGLISASPRASTLHRWTTPVRIEIVFGNTVAEEDAGDVSDCSGQWDGQLHRCLRS